MVYDLSCKEEKMYSLKVLEAVDPVNNIVLVERREIFSHSSNFLGSKEQDERPVVAEFVQGLVRPSLGISRYK